MNTSTSQDTICLSSINDRDCSHNVSMYTVYPKEDIFVPTFEELVRERHSLLQILEYGSITDFKPESEDWINSIKKNLIEKGLGTYCTLINGQNGQSAAEIEARRRDILSHFALRVACCSKEESKSWFVLGEVQWFKLKFQAQQHHGIREFMKINNLNFTRLGKVGKRKLKKELVNSTRDLDERNFDQTYFYEIPFIEALPLITKREVFVKNGYAYVKLDDLKFPILYKFIDYLKNELDILGKELVKIEPPNYILSMYKSVPFTETRVRCLPFMDHIDLHDAAENKFPLCMKHLYDELKTNHHLKYYGRLQFILFLKGIGLTYDFVVQFWESEFTKHPEIGEKRFRKDYLYQVRHCFGLVGNKKNYPPHNCKKILNTQGGCPFKEWDEKELKLHFVNRNFDIEDIGTIFDLIRQNKYENACTKYFECMYNHIPNKLIDHPSTYYEESIRLTKEQK